MADSPQRSIELVVDRRCVEGLEDLGELFFGRGGQGGSRVWPPALGPATCRAIVEVHGGRIWLEDSELGTRVRFSLPRAA